MNLDKNSILIKNFDAKVFNQLLNVENILIKGIDENVFSEQLSQINNKLHFSGKGKYILDNFSFLNS